MTKLEEGQCGLKEDIREIRENHLPHLQATVDSNSEEIRKMKVQLARYAGGLAVLVPLAQYLIGHL